MQGTPEKPRLCLYRSLKHLEAQAINDMEGKTLVALSTRDKDFATKIKFGGNCDAAKQLGEAFAKKAKAAGVERVVFDRGGRLYHGRVKAFADSARSGGLQF